MESTSKMFVVVFKIATIKTLQSYNLKLTSSERWSFCFTDVLHKFVHTQVLPLFFTIKRSHLENERDIKRNRRHKEICRRKEGAVDLSTQRRSVSDSFSSDLSYSKFCGHKYFCESSQCVITKWCLRRDIKGIASRNCDSWELASPVALVLPLAVILKQSPFPFTVFFFWIVFKYILAVILLMNYPLCPHLFATCTYLLPSCTEEGLDKFR